MDESLIESEGVRYAKALGWVVRKASSPGQTGVHDQIHHKKGVTFYIEYKATGKTASPKQIKFAEEMSEAGIPCRCIDSISRAREFINMMDLLLGYDNPLKIVRSLAMDLESFSPKQKPKTERNS